jgi:hypothetical protein
MHHAAGRLGGYADTLRAASITQEGGGLRFQSIATFNLIIVLLYSVIVFRHPPADFVHRNCSAPAWAAHAFWVGR